MSIRINIGCGQTPVKGWRNYDNSWSIRIAGSALLRKVMCRAGLVSKTSQDFISFAKSADIKWADAVRYIPEDDGSADVIYSSHMLEHIERKDAIGFLNEARRVLKSGGVIRIAVPDIMHFVQNYINDGDADNFIERTGMTRRKPKTIIEKIKYLIIGDRNHQWMFDGNSLCKLLLTAGFSEPRVQEPGATIIADSSGLNLEERMDESVFVEAVNP